MSTEFPILFQDDMVRAILDGNKTETRRLVKPLPPVPGPDDASGIGWGFMPLSGRNPRLHYATGSIWSLKNAMGVDANAPMPRLRSPYGGPGDLLWVREAWRPEEVDNVSGIRFRADDAFVPILHNAEAADAWVQVNTRRPGWRPSIHMHRWACRLMLQVSEVRVAQVQDIDEAGAQAEGIDPVPVHGAWAGPRQDGGHWRSARKPFAELWDAINARRGASWDSNPWVWVVTFRLVRTAA